jgi:hypothetical protein
VGKLEILKGLRLGDANPKGSPGTVDIDSIPDKLYDTQVDTSVVVGEGAFKTAYNFKNRPNLLVLLLRTYHRELTIFTNKTLKI